LGAVEPVVGQLGFHPLRILHLDRVAVAVVGVEQVAVLEQLAEAVVAVEDRVRAFADRGQAALSEGGGAAVGVKLSAWVISA
jgi:hypothetical protein